MLSSPIACRASFPLAQAMRTFPCGRTATAQVPKSQPHMPDPLAPQRALIPVAFPHPVGDPRAKKAASPLLSPSQNPAASPPPSLPDSHLAPATLSSPRTTTCATPAISLPVSASPSRFSLPRSASSRPAQQPPPQPLETAAVAAACLSGRPT